MALITYQDKEQHQVNPLPPEKQWSYTDANHIKTVVNQNALREWDNTLNKFPDAGGSGTAGAIMKHNWFIGNGVGNWEVVTGQGAQAVPDGTMFMARIDNPGNTPANWRTI
jgi:hypothetical protein